MSLTIGKGLAVINSFFSLLECFMFTQAGEVLKQRTNSTLHPLWHSFMTPLLLLASSENMYYTLNYLEHRWIRKEYLDNLYAEVHSDLNKVHRACFSAANAPTTTEQEKEELKNLQALIFQTLVMVSLRVELVSLYKTLVSFRGPPDYDKFIKNLILIKDQISLGFNHSTLTMIKYNLETEVSVLLNLLKTQMHLGNYDYKESVVLLYMARTELDMWKQHFLEYVAKRDCSTTINSNITTSSTSSTSNLGISTVHGISGSNATMHPTLKSGVFHWLHLFERSLHSKMTFYFYNIFENNERKLGSGDMNNITSQLEINYYSVVENFVTKSLCKSVCLVLDASTAPKSDSGINYPTGIADQGYQYFPEEQERPQGLKSWPCVFYYPRNESTVMYWPNIVSLIIDNAESLDKYKEPLYYHDPSKFNHTYYISKIESRLLIVLLFDKKRKKNDQLTLEFLFIITTHLRNWKVLARLKPAGHQ